MKVALCVPPFNSALNETCVPYGLGSIAAYLREHVPSVEVKIIDGMAKHDVHKQLLEFCPDIIGVTASTPQALDAYKLLHWCKIAFKNPLTVIGGIHASSLPEEAKLHADIVVVGEGEIAFTRLVKNHLPRKPINGIIQGEPIMDLDSLPPTPYDLVDLKEYLAHGPWLPGLERPVHNMVSSRGCPYKCPFCRNSTRKDPVRYHGAKRVVDEILYIHNRFGVNDFYFSDDEFLLNVKRFKEIAELFRLYGVDQWIRWACQARTQNLKMSTFQLAKSCGLVTVSFGFESGCERMLDFWKDGTTKVADHERAISYGKKAGVNVGGSFIFGGMMESLEMMKESFEWVLGQDNLVFVGSGVLIPYPGTTVWRICKEQRLLPEKVDYNRLVPTSSPKTTYIVDWNVSVHEFQYFLVHATRLMRLYADARRNPSLRNFVGLSRDFRWWWAWGFHPVRMLRLLKKIIKLR